MNLDFSAPALGLIGLNAVAVLYFVVVEVATILHRRRASRTAPGLSLEELIREVETTETGNPLPQADNACRVAPAASPVSTFEDGAIAASHQVARSLRRFERRFLHGETQPRNREIVR